MKSAEAQAVAAPIEPAPEAPTSPPRKAGGAAVLVAAGILFSRLFGFVRARVFAHFFGSSVAAAAFQAATRIPNFLQNLFGEGVLSASFIPVYAKLLGQGDEEEADRLAGAVFGLLSLVTGGFVLLGIFCAPVLVDLIAGGFSGEGRALTIRLVRVLFPATGLLVYSAWCLGILNSHRRFFLSYAAPVIWNSAQIAALLAFGARFPADSLAMVLAGSVVVGSLLQFGVQLPRVRSLLGRFRPSFDARRASVKKVLRGFGPVVLGRGVVQLSAFVDTYFGSLISARAFSTLAYAQTLYLLPVSLFGMSVSAAELPEMSRASGTEDEIAAALRARVEAGLRRIAFFAIPTVAVFFFLGDSFAGLILQSGHFGPGSTRFLWYVIGGATLGLLASISSRLYASAFYALHDTRTPLYFSTVRVLLTAGSAFASVKWLPGWLGVPRELAAVGITATTGLAAWVEYGLLRRALSARIGRVRLALRPAARLWSAALVAAGLGIGVKMLLVAHFGASRRVLASFGGQWLPAPRVSPLFAAPLVLGTFGAAYFALTLLLGAPEARAVAAKLAARLRPRLTSA